jgi:hypothetical protein
VGGGHFVALEPVLLARSCWSGRRVRNAKKMQNLGAAVIICFEMLKNGHKDAPTLFLFLFALRFFSRAPPLDAFEVGIGGSGRHRGVGLAFIRMMLRMFSFFAAFRALLFFNESM